MIYIHKYTVLCVCDANHTFRQICLVDVGEMMMNIFWYYRPEQTDTDRVPKTEDNEVFASRHRDVIPVACIDDKAYVLTFCEYCR